MRELLKYNGKFLFSKIIFFVVEQCIAYIRLIINSPIINL